MLCAGDEMSRTQGGNNNGFCQDTEITWHNWDLDEPRKSLLAFTSRLIHFRQNHPNFHRRSYVEADPGVSQQGESIRWLRSDGEAMGEQDWNEGGWMRTIGMFLSGEAAEIRDAAGVRVLDDDFLVLLNSHSEAVDFALPDDVRRQKWTVVFDTARPELGEDSESVKEDKVKLAGRSLAVLRHARDKLQVQFAR